MITRLILVLPNGQRVDVTERNSGAWVEIERDGGPGVNGRTVRGLVEDHDQYFQAIYRRRP